MERESFNSLAEQFRPRNWDDFIGNEEIKSILTELISSGRPTRGLWISGHSGTGKSSLASLWYKSLLCFNREPGDYKPCGKCPICLGKDSTNIQSYTIADATEAKEQFLRLTDIAKSNPIPKPEAQYDHKRQVIIINEAQNASSQALGTLYEAIENANSKTTWIIITMDESGLSENQRDALSYRCLQINLYRTSKKVIKDKLIECLPKLSEDVADTIAYFSYGNVRAAWSILEKVYPRYSLGDISSELIYKIEAGGCDSVSRSKLWQELQLGNFQEVRNIISSWRARTTEERICELLIEDLLDNPGKLQREILSSLNLLQRAPYKFYIEIALFPFIGRSHYENVEEQYNNTHDSKDRDMRLEGHSQDIDTQLLDAISTSTGMELSREELLLKSEELPEDTIPLFHFNKFSKLLEFYGFSSNI
jgi:DNA polymerase III gamma/tau subunit